MVKSKFTKHQREIAISVLMESRIVRNWVNSQAKFLGVKLDSPEGKTFFETHARAAAERLIK